MRKFFKIFASLILTVALLVFLSGTVSASSVDNFPVGHRPSQIIYDGTSLWVTLANDYAVSKLRPSDGQILGTFPSNGQFPYGLTFDGTYIWVVNYGGPIITKLRVSDGANVGSIPIPDPHPWPILFDGTKLWTTNWDSNIIRSMSPVDGSTVCTANVGTAHPSGIAFDGTYIWVPDLLGAAVIRIKASDCSQAAAFSVGNSPRELTFDGANIWVTNYLDGTVTKLRASDGVLVGTYPVGWGPAGIMYDGNGSIWVSNFDGGTVTRLKANNGSLVETIPVGDMPAGMVYAAGYTWVANAASNTLSRITISPLNDPPSADSGGPYTVLEGSVVTLSGSGLDPDGDPVTFAWDLDNNGTFETTGQNATFSAAEMDGPAVKNAVLQVCDDKGACTTSTATVNIDNVAPTVGSILAPSGPLPVNSVASASATYTDPGVLDTHTAIWDWGDGTNSVGAVTKSNGSGSVTGSHLYTAAGVYTVKLVVTDKDGGVGQTSFNYVVIFDSTAGFVTGAGIINSPAGALVGNPTLTGKANFGFSVKYLPGDPAPSGSSSFRYRMGDINLQSTDYHWLVISSPKAIFQGIGTLNGLTGYSFLVGIIDGQAPGGSGVDYFRVKITDSGGNIVYDTQMGAPDTADPTTPLVGGNTVIH